MRLGIDLDNTLIDYTVAVKSIAVAQGLVPPDSPLEGKTAIRNAIRASAAGDAGWQRVQGELYTAGLIEAEPMAGLEALSAFAAQHDVEIWIISHKTRRSPFDPLGRDLRTAALQWLECHHFFEPTRFGLQPNRVLFAETLEEKVQYIRDVGPDVFIDDLEHVLTHQYFPAGTRPLHFAVDGQGSAALTRCATWPELVTRLQARQAEDALRRALPQTFSEPIACEPLPGGRNAQAFAVTMPTTGERHFAKRYFRHPGDPRDRFQTETRAVKFFRAQGMTGVPGLRDVAVNQGWAVYEFVEGKPVLPGFVTIEDADALLRFLTQLHRAAHIAPEALALPRASEAGFSLAELMDNLRQRRARFGGIVHAELHRFLRDEFDVAVSTTFLRLAEDLDPAAELSPAYRTLSPSDIGFHNALRRPDGELVFHDFEYFGWDDPAKLIADFLLQPEQRLAPSVAAHFLRGALALYGADIGLPLRQALYLDFFRLKWAMILLNEFVPTSAARRRFAGADAREDAELRRERQLQRARAMIAPLLQPTAPTRPMARAA